MKKLNNVDPTIEYRSKEAFTTNDDESDYGVKYRFVTNLHVLSSAAFCRRVRGFDSLRQPSN